MSRETAFWDASAVVPLCVHEAGSRFARQQLRRYAPVVWWATSVEVRSAIRRLEREKYLTEREVQGAVARLELLRNGWSEILPGDDLRDLATDLSGQHVIRAADSLQLAAALTWCGSRAARRVFLCADQRLSACAVNLRFDVVEFP